MFWWCVPAWVGGVLNAARPIRHASKLEAPMLPVNKTKTKPQKNKRRGENCDLSTPRILPEAAAVRGAAGSSRRCAHGLLRTLRLRGGPRIGLITRAAACLFSLTLFLRQGASRGFDVLILPPWPILPVLSRRIFNPAPSVLSEVPWVAPFHWVGRDGLGSGFNRVRVSDGHLKC